MNGGTDNHEDHDDDSPSSDGSSESDSCCTTASDDDTGTIWTSSSSSSSAENTSSSNESGDEDESLVVSVLDDESERDCRRSDGDIDNDVNNANIANANENNLYCSRVRAWTEKVPIGMNLCPWAKLSQKEGRIRYVTCPETIQTPHEASLAIWNEIETLLGSRNSNSHYCGDSGDGSEQRQGQQPLSRSLPPWSTTLVIFPHIEAWNHDFKAFERFVKDFGIQNENEFPAVSPQAYIEGEPLPPGQQQRQRRQQQHCEAIALVPFHPQFLRWRGLPETVSAGTKVRCHKGLTGFSKSADAHPATVVDPRPSGFGRRRIRVQFHNNDGSGNGNGNGNNKTEQCVPVDWVLLEGDDTRDGIGQTNENSNENQNQRRPPLPDNAMHRAPYPVVHILRNEDLAGLSIHDISRLKRRNAKRMASESLV